MMGDFHALIDEAVAHPVQGWDFSYLNGRSVEERIPWDYRRLVSELKAQAASLLDMGTGGGEFISSLAPLPPDTCTTEGYLPNVEVAKQRLEPLGVSVAYIARDDVIPFESSRFEVIINRHESYAPQELLRVLKSGGTFVTQQVGAKNDNRINEYLGADVPQDFAHWNLDFAVNELVEAGFVVVDAQEAYPLTRFYDIGAVVYYLRMVPWQIPDFTVEKYIDGLKRVHHEITHRGCFEVPSHRFLIRAVKPTHD